MRYLPLLTLGLLLSPLEARPQGLGAAAAHTGWFRETAGFVETLEDLAAEGTSLDFSAVDRLTLSLARLAPGEALLPDSVSRARMIETSASAPLAVSCMNDWVVETADDLVACYLANRKLYRTVERIVTAHLSALSASGNCTCCCTKKTEEKKEKKKDASGSNALIPLFSAGAQLVLRGENGEFGGWAPYLSTNFGNALLAEIFGAVFGKTSVTEYFADDISLDLLMMAGGDANGRVLTGVSWGLPTVDLPRSYSARFSGFLRSIPDEVLDPGFLAQSALLDSASSGHSTLGLRLEVFGRPQLDFDPREVLGRARADDERVRQLVRDTKPPTCTEAVESCKLETARKALSVSRWLVEKTNLSRAQRVTTIAGWNAGIPELSADQIAGVARPFDAARDYPIDAARRIVDEWSLPGTPSELQSLRDRLIARLGSLNARGSTVSRQQGLEPGAHLRDLISRWNARMKARKLTAAEIERVVSAAGYRFRRSRPKLYEQLSLGVELSGIFVTQGTPLNLLKNLFTAQDPSFRSSGDFQVTISIGYWFWKKKS